MYDLKGSIPAGSNNALNAGEPNFQRIYTQTDMPALESSGLFIFNILITGFRDGSIPEEYFQQMGLLGQGHSISQESKDN